MKFILGKKMSMTQVWVQDKVIAVTPVLAGPCPITQVKNKTKDGYNALQLAFGTRKEKNINKAQLGQVKNLNIKPAHLREFRIEETAAFKVGDVVSVETFGAGDNINVTGTSKGKGFQGVVKRHHFHGFRKTHGNKDQERMGGSIGPKGPAHVFKGTRMGGRMGGERVTTTNLEIVSVDAAKNILYVKGAVPGAINGLVLIVGQGDLQVNQQSAALNTPITTATMAAAETADESEPKAESENVSESANS
ncbi:MAG: 50S ribosomal protein L3 [Patescibacteria group bacterium]